MREARGLRWLARAVLTALLIGSLVFAGFNLHALTTSPAGAAFVSRSAEGIAAATERALARHATPQAVALRLDALLQEEPRNWLAIEAVEALATERDIPLPADLVARRHTAWEEDSGFWKGAGDCLQCLRDATTCDMALVLMCRAPVELSPVGDLSGVIRGGLDYLAGRDVDEVDVILSAIGLTAVTLALWSGGSSLSIKAGAGLAKLARSMNRLPGALTRPLVRVFREGVDWQGIVRIDGVDDLARLFRPAVMRPAAVIADDAGRMVRNTSTVGALHLMKYVDDPADLSRMARASDVLGPRTVGTIEILGKSRLMRLTMRVADEVFHAVAGLLGGLVALLALLQSLLGNLGLRLLRRRARDPAAS
ncbi:MAG: hypothetical protein LPK02_03255 [Rhodobacterales bacterium]|nr:hypothetical protein [Rhodobacterales bacterium]MDX5412044.1 hypothetical protein [Rhodobacterales bacterium]